MMIWHLDWHLDWPHLAAEMEMAAELEKGLNGSGGEGWRWVPMA